ncbi:HNH nuclease [Oceanibaculum indicum P24]|uniref:HNH nuclease n=2 Tax=Oceanibaculum indicum TaxID=526216 RepID=K2K023_9PROT|nr:HNH nuclease [Oceanibaculum indicum P24]
MIVFDVGGIKERKQALERAILRRRSRKWLLQLWSRFIKTRDAFRCLSCDSPDGIQAHHIIRKTLYPQAALELGNGITLCSECHNRVHEKFNGRPDLSLPLGAEQGDDQDEWSYLFGLLLDDAKKRGIPEDDFYHLSDEVLGFSVSFQGYHELFDLVNEGKISRIQFAHEIWRSMPETFYEYFISELVRLNFDEFPE